MMQIKHTESKHGGVFVYHQDDTKLAEIHYQWRDKKTIVADHTWVDDRLRGQGVARMMLDALVDFAREKQLKIFPTCSYVEVMFRRDKSLVGVIA